MEGTVSTLSIICMAVSLIISFGIPIALKIHFKRKKNASSFAFLIGCIVMVLFAFVLEGLINSFISNTEVWYVISSNLWLYALYGGFMAALFEETGRLIAFKTVLKKKNGNDANALMYGAGHGGIEAIVLCGFAMITNIVYSIMVNAGRIDALIEALPLDAYYQMGDIIDQLVYMPSYMFLLGGIERIFAIAMQLSLSVIVWFAAKRKGKMLLFLLAFVIHFAVDFITVIVNGMSSSAVVLEGIVCVMAIIAVFIARRVWRSNHEEDPDSN